MFDPLDPNADPETIRKTIERQVQRRKSQGRWFLFAFDAVLFVVLTVLAWTIVQAPGTPPDQVIGALLILTAGWGLTLFYQLLGALLDTKSIDNQLRQQEIARLLSQGVFGRYLDDYLSVEGKRKREPAVEAAEEHTAPATDETQDVTHQLRDLKRMRRRDGL